MKSKNIAFVLLCVTRVAVIIVAALSAADVDMRINYKKYHSCEADGLQFLFYGGGGEVRRVKVKQDGKKLCTLSLSADADAFDSVDDAVLVCEINGDVISDLLILTAADSDGDIHRALFLSKDGGYELVEKVDAVNHSFVDGIMISEEKLITYLAEDEGYGEPPSRRETVLREYAPVDGSVVEIRRRCVAYFTETDIYLVGAYEYREDIGECVAVSEKWLIPEKYQKIRAELQEDFSLDIP